MLIFNYKVENKHFKLDYSFYTCLKYRSYYGISILQELENIKKYISYDSLIFKRVLEKVTYIAIAKNNITFEEFKKIVRADKNFILSALIFLNYLLKDSDKKVEKANIKRENANNDYSFDEYKIICIYSKYNLPENLLKELNIFSICNLIATNSELFNSESSSNGEKKYRKMTENEIKALYG